MLLVLMVCDDLCQLIDNELGILRLATDIRKRLRGLLQLALLDEVARGLWEYGQPDRKDDGPQELYGDWDPIASCVVAVLGSIDDAVGQEDTNGDTELVTGDQGATHSLWCNFLAGVLDQTSPLAAIQYTTHRHIQNHDS